MHNHPLSILAVTSEAPWPLNSGGHLRTYHLLRRIARNHRVTLIAPVSPELAAQAGAALSDAGVSHRLVIGRKAARPVQLMAAGMSVLRHQPYVMYRRHYRRTVAAAMRRACLESAPDVIYLDHLDSFLYASCNSAVIVGDLHNVYSTLVERTAKEQRSGSSRRYLAREARLLADAERRAAARADLLLTVSVSDQAYFRGIRGARVEVVPNGVDCARYADLPAGRVDAPPAILFLGAMSWAPNVAAVDFLALEVLPALRQRFPEVRLRIVGRDPSARVMRLASEPGVEVTGAVDDVREYLGDAAILAVPLSAGGGTRLKILEAFAAGLPVVSTPVGCEGIDAMDGRHLTIAPLESFAEAIAGRLAAPEQAAEMARAARTLAMQRYDWDTIGLAASRVIAEVSHLRATHDSTVSAP